MQSIEPILSDPAGGRAIRAWIPWAALAVLSPGIRCGADLPAADQKTATTDVSIDAARKDFSAFRKPAGALDEKVELPKIDVPSIDAGLYDGRGLPEASKSASAASRKAGAQGEPKDDGKSGNWLLRAMEKESLSGARDEKDPMLKELARGSDAGESEAEAAKEPAADSHRTGPVAPDNPLAPFMAQWVSPHEQAIFLTVQPAGGAPAPAATRLPQGGAMESDAAESLLPTGVQPLPSVGDLAPLGGAEALPASDRAMSNPYLAALEAPLAAAATALAPVPSAGLLPASDLRLGSEPPPPASFSEPGAASGVPDFARPSDDDKYFRQLKRF